MTRKAINITALQDVRDTAENLAATCGDRSISALFERLVAEEFSRATPYTEHDAFKSPQVWTAMLGAFPAAVDAFQALADSQSVRDAFHAADVRPTAKRVASPAKRQAKSTKVAPPIQAALAAQKSLRPKRSSPLAAPPSAPSVRG